MKQMFPRTLVGGVSLPRMIIGSNWMLGYSHTGEAADELILSRNGNEAAIAEIVGTYLQYGIDAIMAPKFDSDKQPASLSAGKEDMQKEAPAVPYGRFSRYDKGRLCA